MAEHSSPDELERERGGRGANKEESDAIFDDRRFSRAPRLWWTPPWRLANPFGPPLWRGGDEWDRPTLVLQPPLLGLFVLALGRPRWRCWACQDSGVGVDDHSCEICDRSRRPCPACPPDAGCNVWLHGERPARS